MSYFHVCAGFMEKTSCHLKGKEKPDRALFASFPCHLTVLTSERGQWRGRAEQPSPSQLAPGVSWSCTQRSFNRLGMVWQLPGPISICLVVYAGLRQDGCGTCSRLSWLVSGMFVLTDPTTRTSLPRLIPKHNTVEVLDWNRGHIICQTQKALAQRKTIIVI